MNARTTNAFLLSLTLHGLFAAAFLYSAYALKEDTIDQSKVFELVAGEGDNWAATEAPALGSPDAIKFDLPEAPAPAPPAPEPEPVAPAAPEPVQPAPIHAVPEPKPVPAPKPEPKITPKAAPKAEPAPPDLVKSMKRVQSRVERKQKAEAAKRAKAAAAAAAKRQREADQKAAASKAGAGTKIVKIDAEGIAKGVLGGSTSNKTGGAGGTALSREEQDQLGTYFALLKQRLHEAHEKPEGVSDLLAAQAEFHVAADGTVSRVRIIQSSGNAEFDQSVLSAFRSVKSIGKRPDGRGDTRIVRFMMRDSE